MSTGIEEVIEERRRQDALWGEQNHPLERWHLILGKQFGSFSEDTLRFTYTEDPEARDAAREELIHVAAVAVAAIESLDRAEEQQHG